MNDSGEKGGRLGDIALGNPAQYCATSGAGSRPAPYSGHYFMQLVALFPSHRVYPSSL